MSEQSPAVEVTDLHVRFGEVEAVAGVDLSAHAGQATGLLGRNGAGKSTTMRVLAGLVPPSAGSVMVAGYDVRREPLAVKRVTGYCPDVGGLVTRATAWEHLQLAARLRRMADWEERARDLLERFELGDAAHRVTGGFSVETTLELAMVVVGQDLVELPAEVPRIEVPTLGAGLAVALPPVQPALATRAVAGLAVPRLRHTSSLGRRRRGSLPRPRDLWITARAQVGSCG